jgi:hypothetical protein
MESSKEKLPDDKEASALKSYFEKVYPELDFERVYTSDLKKMVKWFSALSKNQVEIKLSEPAVEEAETEAPIPEVKEIKPEKKTVSKEIKAEVKPTEEKKPSKKPSEPKAAEVKPAKKSKVKKEAVEEKPVKKTTPKKPEPTPAKKSAAKPAAKKPAPKKK